MANPLTKEDLEAIKLAQDALQDVEENLGKAERAGLEVASLKERQQRLKGLLTGIRSNFFPGQ